MTRRVPSAALEGLLYAILAFGPFAFGCVEPWAEATLLSLCYLLALGVFLRGRVAAGAAGTWLWLAPAALALLAVAQAVSAIPAEGARPPWPFSVCAHDTERALRQWSAWAALAWAVPRVVVDADSARRFVRALFGAGVALALLGFLQAATAGGRVYWLRAAPGMLPFGPYYNKDHAANFLLLAAGLGGGLLASRLHEWTDAGRRSPAPGYLRALGATLGGVLLCLAAVLFVKSEGAALALPLGGCAAAAAWAGLAPRPGARLLRAALVAGCAAFVVLLVFGHVGAAADAGGAWDRAVSTRLAIYADSWRWWRDAPLFGTGLGTFGFLYPSYQDSSLRGAVTHAHSDWLELALGGGLLGLLVALAAAGTVLSSALGTLRAGRSREMRALAAGGLVAAAFFAAHALFEFPFQIPGNAAVFTAVCAFVASAPAWRDKSASGRAPSQPPDASGAWLACVLAVVAVWGAARPAVAAALASQAGAPAARLSAQARALDYDADPRLLLGVAAAARELALSREQPDHATLRFALGVALRAAESRPFDAQAQYLAGATLWRLGREGDGRELVERSRRLSFTPLSAPAGERRGRRRAPAGRPR